MAVITSLFCVDETADQRQFFGQVTKLLISGSSMDTFVAVLWTLLGLPRNLTCGHVAKTADPGSSMDTFRY